MVIWALARTLDATLKNMHVRGWELNAARGLMLLWTSRGPVHVQITPLKREKSCFTLNFAPCFEGLLILEATSITFGCDALT